MSYLSKSYVTTMNTGSDGKPYEERYYDNSIVTRGEDGNTISQRQQAYKNTEKDIDRISEEKMLNGEGTKNISERNMHTGEILTTNHYYNLDETKRSVFDNRWDDYNKKIGFTEKHGKYLKAESPLRLRGEYSRPERTALKD